MKKNILTKIVVIITLIMMLTACGDKNKVVIYSCCEDFRNEHILNRLKEEFPDYKIDLQYISTGNSGAKLKAEGAKTECDIIIALDTGYLNNLSDILADLSYADNSAYLPELLPNNNTYLPWERYSGCIAVREDILQSKGIAIPQSYEDLLNPEYKGLISMPNPKSSGTGYMFLKSLVNAWGQEKAFEYFDNLTDNILQYTSSGSGPVNALVQGEAAIALGMTFHTMEEINKGVPLEIVYFNEGAPFSLSGYSMIKGKENKQAVKEVFNFIMSDLVYEDKALFSPEQIFTEQTIVIKNYPKSINYSDMSVQNDAIAEKEELLSKWEH